MTTAREDTTRLVDLLRREHQALGEFLVALSVFDRERRWSELGYTSLFDFLRRELKLSAGAAQYRKTAAQLVRDYPAVEAALRRGDLCLSSVIEVAKVLTPENAAEVLPRFFGKSSRDAAFVSAAIRPVEHPPVREFLVTPVRGAVVDPAADAADVTEGVFRAPETKSSFDDSATAPPVTVPDRPRLRPLDAQRARINMTVSRELLDLLAQARDALSHTHPGASEETIIKVGLQLILDRHLKRRGIGAKPRARKVAAPASEVPAPSPSATPRRPPPRAERSRYIPADVRRAVWERDGGRCAFPLENGEVCGATYQVEFDHVEGWALGAGNTVDELRLACRPHQDVHARALYGDDLMNGYTRPKGPRCSEPVAADAVRCRAAAARAAPPQVARRRRPTPPHPTARTSRTCTSSRSARCTRPSGTRTPRRRTTRRRGSRRRT